MATLPYVIAIVSAWAVIATLLALGRGRKLAHERQEHSDARETITRYKAALSQLKTRAAATAAELEALQRRYLELKQSIESQEQAADEPPIPMIMIDSLDISSEIGTLFEHVARVARTIRNYSAYTRGHHAPEPAKARYDLHWLSDCLHSFDQVGKALAKGSTEALTDACTELLSMYEQYLKDSAGYDSRDTFQRLAGDVPLGEVSDAVRSIIVKAAPALDEPESAAVEAERTV